MKIRSICLALFMLGHAGGMCAQNSKAFTPIGQSAVATLHVPGFADFLVADGDAVWATNQGRVEKLEAIILDQWRQFQSESRAGPWRLASDPCGSPIRIWLRLDYKYRQGKQRQWIPCDSVSLSVTTLAFDGVIPHATNVPGMNVRSSPLGC